MSAGHLDLGRVSLPPNEAKPALTIHSGLEAVERAGLAAADRCVVFACPGGGRKPPIAYWQDWQRPSRSYLGAATRFTVLRRDTGPSTGSWRPATSLGAFDDTFCAGLLEVSTTAVTEGRLGLLIAHHMPPSLVLAWCRTVRHSFSIALAVSARPAPMSRWHLSMGWCRPVSRAVCNTLD